jgi:beta-carotene 3-hydroxylase
VTDILQNATLFLGALVGMELVAYLMHRYVMHGPMWFLHASHHRPRRGRFEWNDLFGVFFSVPSIILIWYGTHGHPPLLWIGLGMTAYGAVYFGFHDVIVHRRLPVRVSPKSRYMRRIIQAHLIHHRTHQKHGAQSFGFLYAPPVEKLRRRPEGAAQG